jgi:hypothetical protein
MPEGHEKITLQLPYRGELFAVGPEAHKDLLDAVLYEGSVVSKLAAIIEQPGIVQFIDMRIGIFVPFPASLPDSKIYVLMLVHAVGGKRKNINNNVADVLSFD